MGGWQLVHPSIVQPARLLTPRQQAKPVEVYLAPKLTQEQQRKTMQNDSMMPAIPTTQVRRRKRMTPKMFWRQGR